MASPCCWKPSHGGSTGSLRGYSLPGIIQSYFVYPWCCTREPGLILGLGFFLPPVPEDMRHVIQPCSGES